MGPENLILSPLWSYRTFQLIATNLIPSGQEKKRAAECYTAAAQFASGVVLQGIGIGVGSRILSLCHIMTLKLNSLGQSEARISDLEQ